MEADFGTLFPALIINAAVPKFQEPIRITLPTPAFLRNLSKLWNTTHKSHFWGNAICVTRYSFAPLLLAWVMPEKVLPTSPHTYTATSHSASLAKYCAWWSVWKFLSALFNLQPSRQFSRKLGQDRVASMPTGFAVSPSVSSAEWVSITRAGAAFAISSQSPAVVVALKCSMWHLVVAAVFGNQLHPLTGIPTTYCLLECLIPFSEKPSKSRWTRWRIFQYMLIFCVE